MVDAPDSLGIVETSREGRAEWMREVRKRNLPLEYYDSFIRVEFLTEQGTFTHGHIPPIDLEFSSGYHAYQEELWGTKQKNGICEMPNL